MKKLILALMLAVVAMAASAKDIKTLILTTTPQMHCESCEARIKDGLKYVKGVKDIRTSIPDQKVYVKYDADKTTEEKILKALEKAGYKGEKTTEDAKIEKHEDEQCDMM